MTDHDIKVQHYREMSDFNLMMAARRASDYVSNCCATHEASVVLTKEAATRLAALLEVVKMRLDQKDWLNHTKRMLAREDLWDDDRL